MQYALHNIKCFLCMKVILVFSVLIIMTASAKSVFCIFISCSVPAHI